MTAVLRLALALLVAVLAAAGCSGLPPIPSRVCGTITEQPIRVHDRICEAARAGGPGTSATSPAGPVRWWSADPRCLDPDDRTPVGAPLDDDYLGEPCDRRPATPRAPTPPRLPPTHPAPSVTHAAPAHTPSVVQAGRTYRAHGAPARSSRSGR